MGLLQNIFRHSNIPEYLLETLQYVPTFNSSFIEFYRVKNQNKKQLKKIFISFFYYFMLIYFFVKL